jgi:hypothetical protein
MNLIDKHLSKKKVNKHFNLDKFVSSVKINYR